MSDLFTEVDEALKQERLEKLWKDYGGALLGFLGIVVLGTAANAGYSSYQESVNAKSTDIYLDTIGIEAQPEIPTQQIVDNAGKMQPNLAALALLNAAKIELESGNTAQAVTLYEQIAESNKYEDEIKYLANYLAISTNSKLSDTDKLTAFTKISQENGNPYRYRAALDAALLEADINQDFTKARALLNDIAKAENVPQTIKQKAQSIDIVYAVKEKAKNQPKTN